MMSEMGTPFGPVGRAMLTYRVDAVVCVDKMGGPRVARQKR